MSTMIKINSRFERNENIGESDIYRKFSEQFDNLFNADELAKNSKEFEDIYVSDIDFEDQIKRFRNSETNMAKFCVGYTGIGKSTSIRHCFGLGVSNEAYLNRTNKEIVFPTFLDGYQISDIENFDLSTRIAAVCTEFEELYPELRELLKTDSGKEEFYHFIRAHTGFALEKVNPVDTMDMDDHQLILHKLNSAYLQSPFEFQANKLKFYIKKNYDKYERLIIILDDIESLPEDYQIQTIGKYLKLQACMQNTDYPEEREYHVNLLISVRPHTYRIINHSRSIETFPISDLPILKKKSVNLEYIFEKRFNYYTKNSKRPIGNIDTWKKCYDELISMNRVFEGKYKDMICNLCFMNVREALSSYARVFANRFWVQKNKYRGDIFGVNAPEYSFNNINVIRALACNEETVYWGDESSIIPDIFCTTKDLDLSLHCLLVIRYFREKKGNEVYGLNAEFMKDVKEEWSNIFGEDHLLKLIKSLEYLFERKILRKSIKDFDEIKTLDTIDSLEDRSRLYISPRGSELYAMLSRDSVLLEMLRENAWRDYENRNYSEKTSSELMKDCKQKDIFKDLLEYTDYLRELEDDILCIVKENSRLEEYVKAFGNTSIIQDILTGIKNSLDYSGIMQDPEIKGEFNTLKEKVKRQTKNYGMIFVEYSS